MTLNYFLIRFWFMHALSFLSLFTYLLFSFLEHQTWTNLNVHYIFIYTLSILALFIIFYCIFIKFPSYPTVSFRSLFIIFYWIIITFSLYLILLTYLYLPPSSSIIYLGARKTTCLGTKPLLTIIRFDEWYQYSKIR